VIGWDTGPGNMVIDSLVDMYSEGSRQFDEDGKIAATGTIDMALLEELQQDEFVRAQPPKSTGREYYTLEYIQEHFHISASSLQRSGSDLIATATEWTAASIAENITTYWKSTEEIHHLIVSGGGACNQFLMGRLQTYFPQAEIRTSEQYGIPADAKEAIGFAVLAYAFLSGTPANMTGVTGADNSLILGKLTL